MKRDTIINSPSNPLKRISANVVANKGTVK